MKARHITTQRIGKQSTRRYDPPGARLLTVIPLFVVAGVLVYVLMTRPQPAASVVQITSMPTATIEPTATLEPTQINTSTPTVAPTPTPEVHGVVLAQVWLYDAPGGERLPAGLLKGQEVVILESRKGFVKVQTENLTGWVTERWISVE